MRTTDLYEEVTAQIIAELEAGAPPWVKSWNSGSYLPHNGITHRKYSGINVLILLMKGQRAGYPSARWMTFKQALAAGACVRKGEKATTIVFVKRMTIHEEGEDPKPGGTMLKTFSVFNAAQIDGLSEQELDPIEYPNVDEFIQKTGVKIVLGEPCYVPSMDVVMMPPRASFHTEADFYATALHETVHNAERRIMPHGEASALRTLAPTARRVGINQSASRKARS